ncbi:hypothetical protein EDF22_0665 [Rathayibacter sp. PhB127]|uniref:hypothetical protein n=1 Tax=Rathayibacter sp. PhB127 TaxID=2485176 RepID=UPI000F92BC81|nr:hypothetical protein [Rathayibacter sp. PhB127]ROS28933.1 hypothetical protein EDF22_0665 [Rathayibacter sp. PhB127]
MWFAVFRRLFFRRVEERQSVVGIYARLALSLALWVLLLPVMLLLLPFQRRG